MKLDKFSLVFEVDFESYKKHHIDCCLINRHNVINTEQQKMIDSKISFYKQTGFRKLVLSKKSKDNLENYQVPKNIRVEVLRSLPNRKDIIMIDELNCIKYVKTDTELFVTINFRTNNVTRLNVIEPTYLVYFHVDLINGNVVSDQYDFQTKKFINQEDLIEKYYSKFLVLVTYLELTDVTLNIVEGGKKTGDIMRGNLFKNDTKQSVIQVNTNWNVQTISLNSFGVRGHWKLQPCGKGLCTFKHIYIQPYEKGLVRRLSQKELVN